MKRRERLLIVTHRFGPDIPGGAERHVWELATRLRAQEGIECEVWTTDARGLGPVAHWGVALEPGYAAGETREVDGLVVRRFPIRGAPRAVVALACKAVQRQWEREEAMVDPARFLPFGAHGDGENADELDLPDFLAGPGWHHPEPQADGSILRWTHPRFTLLRKAGGAGGTLTLSGFAPRRHALRLTALSAPAAAARLRAASPFPQDLRRDKSPGQAAGETSGSRGWFTVSFEIPPAGASGATLTFDVEPAFCPLRDHRSLGLMVREITFRPAEAKAGEPNFDAVARVTHWEDYRALLRRRWDDLVAYYTERARARPDWCGPVFDWVRGPRCPALWRALSDSTLADRFDGVMAANLPWAVIPRVVDRCRLPVAALALWHLDDEFYYWNHYIQALQSARVVLSNTKWAAETVWPGLGVEARWAGPGVEARWAETPARRTRAAWRRELGLPPHAPVVLCVCRKSASKRYDLVVAAVERLRRDAHPEAALVLVGPDEDRRPVDSPAVRYTGTMNDADLHDAYRSADAFAMMSESESFGMVFVEAWLRGLPVVGNRWCGPVASLIDHGRDGFLASGVVDLAEALDRLLANAELRMAFGRAGKEKTMRDHVWSACVSRVATALREEVFS